MTSVTVKDATYFLLPMVVCYLMSALCPVGKDAGDKVKFRPPSSVFGIVWGILFVLFGLSWVVAMRNSRNKILCFVLYILTTLSLALWIYIYGCRKSKKTASWILILSVALSLMCFTQGNDISRILIAPLIAWALFAQIMNTTEVQN